MKYDKLHLSQHTTIETYRDHNGRVYIAYSSGSSVFIRDAAELRRFLRLPKGLPMRESLDSWLASLADQDAQRKAPKAAEVDLQQTWDPLAHGLDPSDPQFQTRSVI